MKIFLKAAAALLAVGVTTTAHAAVVTRSYEVTGTFKGGSLTKVTTSFDLTFDATPSTTYGYLPITVANFKSDGGASFSNPVAKYLYWDFGMGTSGSQIQIGGQEFADRMTSNDFLILISNSAGGAFVLEDMVYTDNDTEKQWGAVNMTIKEVTAPTPGDVPGSGGPTPEVPVAAAVPEPATWAMMILGFGVVGGSMRRRTRPTLRTA